MKKEFYVHVTSELEDGSSNFSIRRKKNSIFYKEDYETIHSKLNTKTFSPLDIKQISSVIEDFGGEKEEVLNYLYQKIEEINEKNSFEEYEEDLFSGFSEFDGNDLLLLDGDLFIGKYSGNEKLLCVKRRKDYTEKIEDYGLFHFEYENHNLGKNFSILIRKEEILFSKKKYGPCISIINVNTGEILCEKEIIEEISNFGIKEGLFFFLKDKKIYSFRLKDIDSFDFSFKRESLVCDISSFKDELCMNILILIRRGSPKHLISRIKIFYEEIKLLTESFVKDLFEEKKETDKKEFIQIDKVFEYGEYFGERDIGFEFSESDNSIIFSRKNKENIVEGVKVFF